MDDVIYFVSETFENNEYGVPVAVETKRQVFAKVRSITRAEFFGGGRNGLNPELRFDVFKGDYEGESIIEYNGKRYGVYRVYDPYTADSQSSGAGTDYIELYVERKGGLNG